MLPEQDYCGEIKQILDILKKNHSNTKDKETKNFQHHKCCQNRIDVEKSKKTLEHPKKSMNHSVANSSNLTKRLL